MVYGDAETYQTDLSCPAGPFRPEPVERCAIGGESRYLSDLIEQNGMKVCLQHADRPDTQTPDIDSLFGPSTRTDGG